MELEAEMRALAERQHGVVSVSQARQMTESRAALRSRVTSKGWVRETPMVLRLAGSPRTYAQRCMAAVLDSGEGALLSHHAAGLLWQLPGFSPGLIHVSRLRGRNRRKTVLAAVHEPRLLPVHHGTLIEAIPVTCVARTVFDLAGHLHPQRAERVLDNALARKLVDLRILRLVAIELLEHGRAGSALMRRLLEERGVDYIPPASGLEALFFSLLVMASLELPERQVDLGGAAWEGRVDYYYRRLRLIIEIDSELHHTSKLDAEADARRDAALRAAGFRVLRITEEQLKRRPWEVVALVRAALAEAAA